MGGGVEVNGSLWACWGFNLPSVYVHVFSLWPE